MLLNWWQSLQAKRRASRVASAVSRRAIHDALWTQTLQELPFLSQRSPSDLARLRQLASLFLDSKEFSGAQGFEVRDEHAVMVAVQACLPILHIAPPERPDLALQWYDGFVGIVLHAGEVRAKRQWLDEDGIEHTGTESLTGEMLEGGPLMLSWADVQTAGQTAGQAYNVVIHEFAHVMDVRDGLADGCPPMPREVRQEWLQVLNAEYEAFVETLDAWDRFGAATGMPEPLLDAYASTSPDEFFAVAAEAFFVQPQSFALAHPALKSLFDAFFLNHSPSG
jgi:Mlc titration factor MtfA (ptsG expression regulator)